MPLELSRLECVRQRGETIIARCPACAEMDRDRSGDHLAVFEDGRFACAAFAGDHGHRQRIFALAGDISRTQPIARGPMPPPSRLASPPELPPDFGRICQSARYLVWDSTIVQHLIAAEFGISPKTAKACAMPAGGAIGFFPRISIQGKPCLPDRIAYLYPHGIKVRDPWGKHGVRFAWAYGRATEPWRYTLNAWRPWIKGYLITEGESDALALIEAGLGNVCDGNTAVVASPGTSFLKEWGKLFSGRETMLCFDIDEAGQQAAERVARVLSPHARSVRILNDWEGINREC